MSHKIKLLIAYDGTAYSGWQIQNLKGIGPDPISIQGELNKALKTFLGVPVKTVGAGRTDAGVHAEGQVVHFTSEEPVDPYRLLRSLNGLLPDDIRVKEVEQVEDAFHALYSAKRKVYHYHLTLSQVQEPFSRRYAYHVRKKIDVELLRQAASWLVGTHDFTSFANHGGSHHHAVRTLYRVEVVEEKGGVRLEFEGNGFLYKMVRNLTGLLLEVASGKLPVQAMSSIFAAKDRRKAPRAVPPHGLFLVHVGYDS